MDRGDVHGTDGAMAELGVGGVGTAIDAGKAAEEVGFRQVAEDGEVEEAVVDAGRWDDAHAAAEEATVGDDDGKGEKGNRIAVGIDLDRKVAVADEGGKKAMKVRDRAAGEVGRGSALTDGGVEAEASHVDKNPGGAVGEGAAADIDEAGGGEECAIHGRVGPLRDTKGAREISAPAGGEDTEGSPGARLKEAVGDLVDRAVAADGEDKRSAIQGEASGYPDGFKGSSGHVKMVAPIVAPKGGDDLRKKFGGTAATSGGVEDDADRSSVGG